MPERHRSGLILFASLAPGMPGVAVPDPLPLGPLPASVLPAGGSFTLGSDTRIGTAPGDRGAAAAARLLAAQLKVVRGIALGQTDGKAGVRFVRDRRIQGREAYRLTVDASGIVIAASADAGLVCGAMTLAQLASPAGRFAQPAPIAAVVIAAMPRFA